VLSRSVLRRAALLVLQRSRPASVPRRDARGSAGAEKRRCMYEFFRLLCAAAAAGQ